MMVPCRGDQTGVIVMNGQGDEHKVVPPQPAINNVKDPLQVSKVSYSNTAWVLNLLQLPDQHGA